MNERNVLRQGSLIEENDEGTMPKMQGGVSIRYLKDPGGPGHRNRDQMPQMRETAPCQDQI